MARVDNLENFLTDVAGAIREKKGTQDQIPAENFDTEIKSIETGTKINNQDKDITKNGTYTADEGYTGLGTVIVNVPQTGDVPVKLFKTKEEMNSSTGNVKGDLAVVYKNEMQNMTADMEVTAITFPETVTLPTAFTGRANVNLSSVDRSVMFDGRCMLSKTSFGFNASTSNGYIRASYTSEDGITYTRTSLQGDSGDLDNPVTLPTAVEVQNDGWMDRWNNNFGYFMQIGEFVFEGVYVYKNNGWKLAPTQLAATSDYVYKQLLFYGKNGIESGTLGIPDNSFVDTTAKVYNEIQNQYDNMEPRILTDDDKTIDKNIYFIPVKRDGTPLLDTSNVTNMYAMFQDCSNLTTIPQLNTSNATDMQRMFSGCLNLTAIALLDTSKATKMTWIFNDCKNLVTIPQLNTSNVTDMANMFENCINLTTIPKLDTSNATSMSAMFYGCSSLTIIPELNTSNVTDMTSMFNGCTNLTTIPELDTSSVTDMRYMFNGCTNLTTIPELNTSKVTNMLAMFNGCSSLSDDSLNNIMQMCANATSYTGTKTLNQIGLISEQADKCKTLSNYSAFTSAGWTTGY